ncbi:MAG TPA: SH3 domain-containing protein [Pyrinomonadaceae bacterium]|jgi:hypothetical protein
MQYYDSQNLLDRGIKEFQKLIARGIKNVWRHVRHTSERFEVELHSYSLLEVASCAVSIILLAVVLASAVYIKTSAESGSSGLDFANVNVIESAPPPPTNVATPRQSYNANAMQQSPPNQNAYADGNRNTNMNGGNMNVYTNGNMNGNMNAGGYTNGNMSTNMNANMNPSGNLNAANSNANASYFNGLVIMDDAPLKSAPRPDAPTEVILSKGGIYIFEPRTSNGWYRVRTGTGRVGWMDGNDLRFTRQ